MSKQEMKIEILDWLNNIENIDGMPPVDIIAFNLGLFQSDQGYMMYIVGAFEYTEDDDDWACIEPPKKSNRYLKLTQELQSLSWESILDFIKNALYELESERSFDNTILKHATAITTGFDDGELIKIR